MGFGKDGSRGSDVANAEEEKAAQLRLCRTGSDPSPALDPAEADHPGLVNEAALQGDQLERSMKSFQKRLNSAFFPLCICTALAYLCT